MSCVPVSIFLAAAVIASSNNRELGGESIADKIRHLGNLLRDRCFLLAGAACLERVVMG